MIEARGLTKVYGPVVAVRDVSFNVEKGQVVGFLGRNGAGKTTTMRMLTGYAPPNAGRAFVGGHDVSEEPVAAKRLIGYLPEKPPLYDDLTVTEYLSFAASLKGVPRQRLTARLGETAEACGLTEVRGRLIGNLSKGYRQRVGLAQALVHEPQVLILDEPTVGLDPGQILEIRELIKKLRADRTIILSTHILQEVTASCEKVIVIHQGSVVAEDSVRNLTQQTQRARMVLHGAPAEEEVKASLQSVPGVESARPVDGGAWMLQLAPDPLVRSAVAAHVVRQGWHLLEFHSITKTLEEVFLELTAAPLPLVSGASAAEEATA